MIQCILNLPVALLILASSLLYFCPLSVRERQIKNNRLTVKVKLLREKPREGV